VTSWTYLTQSVPWILAGLLVGFFVGRSTAAVDAIAGAVRDEGEPMPEHQPVQEARRRRPRVTVNGVLGAVIVALGIFTAVQSYVQSEATARLTECQTAYANGFADALDARSKASVEAQEALDEWMTKVNSTIQAPSPEAATQIREAFADYLKARSQAKETQQANPYPPAPRDVCKETG
jgi:hypothetical protein